MSVWLLAAIVVTVQGDSAPTWHLLTTQDGLPDTDVRTIFQDRDGTMWFGTRNAGVASWDGDVWSYYTANEGLASDGVLDIWQTADGTIWAVGGRGYSRFDGSRWRATNTVGTSTPNVVFDVFEVESSGAVWLGFNGGAGRFDGFEWQTVTASDGLPFRVVHNVFENESGTVWFACRRGLVSLADGEWTVLYRNQNFRSIMPDRTGRVWFGSSNGAYELVEGGWQVHLEGQDIQPVAVDLDGLVWSKTDTDGVYAFDGHEWHHFSTQNEFPSDTVHGITVAADGTVWFATAAGAVWRENN